MWNITKLEHLGEHLRTSNSEKLVSLLLLIRSLRNTRTKYSKYSNFVVVLYANPKPQYVRGWLPNDPWILLIYNWFLSNSKLNPYTYFDPFDSEQFWPTEQGTVRHLWPLPTGTATQRCLEACLGGKINVCRGLVLAQYPLHSCQG